MTEPQDDDAVHDRDDQHDESVIDEMRGSGVGTEDPNIVGGDTHLVDEQVAKDEPPQV